MKTIEILLPEIAELYGEIGAINYIKQSFASEKIIETKLHDTPYFMDNDVDFIYLGPMSEKWQPKVIDKFMPYRDRLKELIENEVCFLTISTGFEIFGSRIVHQSGDETPALGIFDYYSVQDFSKRYNQVMVLNFNDDYVVGAKSQFSQIHGIDEKDAFMSCVKGNGNYVGAKVDGFKYKNFHGTQIIGPILLCNQEFTRYLFKLVDPSIDKILYEDIIAESHEARLGYNMSDEIVKTKKVI